MKPHISIRKHMCWNPNGGGKPSEPTSTIVLTSARNLYVDVRILTASNSNSPAPGSGGDPFTGLDWAFAGTSRTLRSATPEDPAEIVEWEHWVDSRNLGDRRDNAAKDIGRCYLQKNGETQELGSMINPETGVETEYEELWGSVKIESVGPSAAEKVAVVLRTAERSDHSTAAGQPLVPRVKGLVIRIGQFVQGVLEHDGAFTVERWAYDQTSKRWTEVLRMGSAQLPCSQLFDPAQLVEGRQLSCGPTSWQVVELSAWRD